MIAQHLYPSSATLCYKCHQLHDPRESSNSCQALRLALTCKPFHRLFKELTKSWLHITSENWLDICRFILEHPEELNHIQSVHFKQSYCNLQSNMSPEQLDNAQIFLNKYQADFEDVLRRVIRTPRHRQHKSTPSTLAKYSVFFVLASLPNVRQVMLSPSCIDLPDRLRLNSLPNVKDLQFHHNSLHCDQHQFEIRQLCSIMPRLTSLRLADLDERDSGLHHANIKHLTLANTGVGIRGLDRLLEGFPSLQSLEYIPDPEEWRVRPVISRRLSKVLTERCPNLEELSLDFSSIVRPSEDTRVAPYSLLSLNRLKRLQLRGFSFPVEVARHLQRLPLKEILPCSIEDLTIYQSTNNQLMVELLQVVSDSPLKFPLLRRISLGHLRRDIQDCASACETGERLVEELRQSCSEAQITLDCGRFIPPSCA